MAAATGTPTNAVPTANDTAVVTGVYQLFPDLDPETFAALREDIARDGVLAPVDVDEHGQVLDGHHRAKIAGELGIDYPTRIVEGLSERDKLAYAARVNALRRGQLAAGERRPAVVRLYVEAELTQQAIADVLGVAVQTVSDDLRISGVGKTDPRGRPPKPPEPADEPEPVAEDGPNEPELEPDDEPTRDPNPEPVAEPELDPHGPDGDASDDETPPEPPKPRRRPLPDALRDAGIDLNKAIEKVQRLVEDDRFPANRTQVTPQLRGHLRNTVEVCQDLLDLLATEEG